MPPCRDQQRRCRQQARREAVPPVAGPTEAGETGAPEQPAPQHGIPAAAWTRAAPGLREVHIFNAPGTHYTQAPHAGESPPRGRGGQRPRPP